MNPATNIFAEFGALDPVAVRAQQLVLSTPDSSEHTTQYLFSSHALTLGSTRAVNVIYLKRTHVRKPTSCAPAT